MLDLGVHKQIVNRLLEPFSHINVLCTATEYANFFGLRLDAAAQPEMRALAEAMHREYTSVLPIQLKPGEWHLPFFTNHDGRGHTIRWDEKLDNVELIRRVSVARCARVSYLSNDTGRESTIEEDLALYDRLVGAQPLHASPAEHQATPDHRPIGEAWAYRHQWGNFTGWRQYRKMLPGEACAPLPGRRP
jgi:hypothetical protein